MTKFLKNLFNISLVLFFIIVFSPETLAEINVPAPTLIAPNEKTATASLKPVITGLTKDNTTVEFFIDGVYDGGTGILRDNSGTANFVYKPSVNLSRGWHKIIAKAFNDEGLSLESNILNFKIELPLPAPTIFKPVVNQSTSSSRPFIVGLAKNDSKVKIYIDNKYNGELMVKNHLSGTANFAFKPVITLTRGAHSVYTIALDKRGKESIRSNTIDFFTKNSAIAQAAEEEKTGVVVKIKESKQVDEIKSAPIIISENSGAVLSGTKTEPVSLIPESFVPELESNMDQTSLTEKESIIKQDLKNKENAALEKIKSLIGKEAVGTKSDRGMINEGKKNQGRLKLDLALFILFLLGVVLWLLWVNRELVKERRAQAEAEEKVEADQNNSSGGGFTSPAGE